MTKKVAPIVIFTFEDAGLSGAAAALAGSLMLEPHSSLRRLEEAFELPLDRYDVDDAKACGSLIHFVDGGGAYQVSILLMQSQKPPILACSLDAVLSEITAGYSQDLPSFILPFFSSSSRLKHEKHTLSSDQGKSSLYGLQIGKENATIGAMMAQTKRPPPTLQFHYEPLACLLHFVRVLKVPAFLLIGEVGSQSVDKGSKETLERLQEMGQLLASVTNLCFAQERIALGPLKSSKEGGEREAWRALYG
ncbi:hypothetical protein MLD38_033103 [Melastoma candidum]|uniref:Uncharacterized protein n=1 Tax=Melastoma candidum TaxID=119954 RepID=A0ACB9M6Z5_9MYRT|nr:hypothetical protein MLD38_033103 [Melastoma candidum]